MWYLIDNDRRITNEVGELQYSLAETMHSLADDLARELGERVRLATPVTRIEHGPEGVRVVNGTGNDRRPMPCWSPCRRSWRRGSIMRRLCRSALARALGAWRSGTVIKVLIRYRRAFWRDRGQSGMVMWREPPGLFAFDLSRDAAHPELAFFIGGPLAIEWSARGEEAQRAEVAARLVAALGPEAGEMLDMAIRDWSGDRWSGGAYSDLVVDMQARDAEAVLRAGIAAALLRLVRAVAVLSRLYRGAIVAGQEAAAKVIASLAERQTG